MSLRKWNSKLISKLDDTSQKKNVYMRVMLHKTGRRASLPVMNLAKFDAAFTRNSSSSKGEHDGVNNQPSKSFTQTCTSDSAEAETESNASSSNSKARSSTEKFLSIS